MNITASDQQIASSGISKDQEYSLFLYRLSARFMENVEHGARPVFTTRAEGLADAYLRSFPPETRQHHNCNACLEFIEKYGSIALMDGDGIVSSALWVPSDAPAHYREAVSTMADIVSKSPVTGVFVAPEKVLGRPITGDWCHLSVEVPPHLLCRKRGYTSSQVMAEKREDYRTLCRALSDYPLEAAKEAVRVLDAEVLARGEKVADHGRWFLDLMNQRSVLRGRSRDNVTWLAVSRAPAGFCHVRSTMLGFLLDDIVSGLSFAAVSRRFAEKMDPLVYQRPQALPSSGAVEAAERLVSKLGIERSLERRFARLDEVQALWKPIPAPAPAGNGGVFGGVPTKSGRQSYKLAIPAVHMTWVKFEREILPIAEKIEFFADATLRNYTSLVTAVHAEAPPIIQWDHESQRNPVSWYVWNGGSRPESFGLDPREYHELSAICLKPSMWNGGTHDKGKGVILIIDGAKDKGIPGACLFPEILKSELHPVRSVIEAYSKENDMRGVDDASAAGLFLGGSEWNVKLRITCDGSTAEYILDRWD